ncbi:MAG: hypothetical protein SFV54_12780 [Bryobacteraceae bacterium]|nr:hypothetical protein [Bryobacteraceae bacterium]
MAVTFTDKANAVVESIGSESGFTGMDSRLRRLLNSQRLITGYQGNGGYAQGFQSLASLQDALDRISRGAVVYTDFTASKTMTLTLSAKYRMALSGQLATDLHFVFTALGERQPDLSDNTGNRTVIVTRNNATCYLVLSEDKQALKEILFVRGEETYGKELVAAFRWNDTSQTFSR